MMKRDFKTEKQAAVRKGFVPILIISKSQLPLFKENSPFQGISHVEGLKSKVEGLNVECRMSKVEGRSEILFS